jgi:D-3-phosphoglycerate dehydrogenase
MRLLVCDNLDHLPEFRQKTSQYFETDYICSECDFNIGDYDYLIPSLRYRLDENILAKAVNLKAISTPSTGTDHIDFTACSRLGIDVFSLKDDTEFLSGITATAELAFSLILNVMRKIPSAYRDVLDGNWTPAKFRGFELQGKTLGILGCGRLGSIMIDYAQAFRMNVLVCDPYKQINRPNVRQVVLDELLQESDIITLHVHLNEETKGLIGSVEFWKMKQGVVIVNTSRGAIIDTPALLDALGTCKVMGAGLDVLDGELNTSIGQHPMVEYARTHDNVIITPHMGGVTLESQRKAYMRALDKLIQHSVTAQ